VNERLQLINGTLDYADLGDVDLVIEAVFESPDIKKEVFAKLDAVCKPGCILASNTSYQDIDDIATATGRPADVCGMHFFSPANVMKLLEVVRGEKTSKDILATVMKLGKKIDKVCVLSKVCYGFIGNRMLSGYGREAQMLLMDGCTPAQVDSALENFGMAMGVIAMSDLAGLDVGYKARKARSDLPKDPKGYIVADKLVEMGRLGQKSGAGFYKYDPNTRARTSDPEVEALIRAEAEKLGVEQQQFSDAEILQRCFYPLINEGALILEEGIAQRPSDIDVVYVYGYAFPVAKGGPMFWADQIGLQAVYDKICEFRDRYGEQYWKPAPLLERLAKEGKTFAQWARENS
jgi:3-hydroxyacyl-CoA dehydrogenase